jgi:collagen type VI alpha
LKADIVIVVDESGSVGNGNFEKTKKATAKMVNELKAGGSELRVGLAKFATEARENTAITANLTIVHDDALVMTYAGAATNTRAGYEKAWEMLKAASRGPEYQQIIVFMTDGVTSAGTPPDDRFSLKLYKAGVEVITVGIADYSESELLTMARDPNNLIRVPNFDRMEEMVVEQVFEKACQIEVQKT